MKPASFDYRKAESVEHCLELLDSFDGEARPIAGGQSLVPMMNFRLARPTCLIDIGDLPLNEIVERADALEAGALVRHRQYLTSEPIRRHFPVIRSAVKYIGHPTIRENGTTGGSIAHADPSTELPLMCVLNDAVINARSRKGSRGIPARDFFLGPYTTDLQPNELLTSVTLPIPARRSRQGFQEFAERKGDFALSAVGAVLEYEGETVSAARIACTGAEQFPIRLPEVEQVLVGSRLEPGILERARQVVHDTITPPENYRTTQDFLKQLIGTLLLRCLTSLEDGAERGA